MATAVTILFILNMMVFMIYGADKYRAVRGDRRISESTLLLCGFLFGAAGALLGMLLFRHKIRNLKFRILLPLAAIADGIVIYALAVELSIGI